MDEIEMKLQALSHSCRAIDFMLDDLRAEQITRELLYEAAQQGISPDEVLRALDDDAQGISPNDVLSALSDDDVLEAEVIEDPAAKIADKAKRLLNYPVTSDDVLKAADEVAEVAKANNTTPEAVIKEVAKEHPKTTVKIKVFND